MISKNILNYTIISFIGSGGMGSVYLAEHHTIKNQRVAIKVIKADLVNDFTRQRIKEEAELLASLQHPNIVRFHDFHIDEDGNIYLIMEYADGVGIDDYIRNVTGLIVEDRICSLFEPILDAVDYAHRHKIVHRDIKPSNIIITKEGVPKILDFGIAGLMNDNEETAKEKIIMGTPSYMSPEQVKGDTLDARSDIYSLGVLLHEMMTGNPPYDTTTLTEFEINQKVVDEPLPRMRQFYKYVSDGMQRIVDKATAKNRDDRFRSCAEFKKELHRTVYPPKMPRWVWVAASAILLICIGAGVGIWDYNRLKTGYYRDYTEKWGVPVGIGKLSAGERTHANRMYRIESSRGKVRRLSHVNSVGAVIGDTESERALRPNDAEYSYGADGHLSSVKVKDTNGRVVYVMSYNENMRTLTFRFDDEHGTEKTIGNETIGYVDALGQDDGTKKGRISRWLLTYDDNGYVTEVDYAGFQNVRVGDKDNIFGRRYVRDDKGRVIEESYVGIDGQPKSTRWGLGIKTFEYDSDDNWVKSIYLTTDRTPALDGDGGVSVYTMQYDSYGNLTEARHFFGDDTPMIPKRLGVHGYTRTYDDHGFVTREDYIDTLGQPTFNTYGFAYAMYENDERGFGNEIRLFDTEGNPTYNSSGISIIRSINDASGNALVVEYFDADGNPTISSENVAKVVSRFDSLGNVISRFCYGTDGALTASVSGDAGFEATYDKFNRCTSTLYFGTDSLPAPNNDGIIYVENEYDVRGNQIASTYFEAPDSPKLRYNSEHVAGWRGKYDDNGNMTETSWIDTDGNVSSCGYGTAVRKMTYDDNGNRISQREYDESGNLVINGIGAGFDKKYDSRGNCVEYLPIGCDGKLMANRLIERYGYDSNDNVVSVAYFNAEGKPAYNLNKVHRETSAYNNNNQLVESRSFDTEGKPAPLKGSRCAVARYEYDERGNISKRMYFGVDGKPVNGQTEPWSSSKYEHDAMGNITHQLFFDTEGKPTDPKTMVPEGFARYDIHGNRIYVAAGDGKGNIIMNPLMGACIAKAKYDNNGNRIERSYFDAKERPMLCTVGEKAHLEKYTYDIRDNQTSVSLYDTAGKPMNGSNGYHRQENEYDNLGRQTVEAYFDKNGKPSGATHKITFSYAGDNPNPSYARIYNTAGKLTTTLRWNGSSWEIADSYPTSATQVIDVDPSDSSDTFHEFINELTTLLPLDLGSDSKDLELTGVKSSQNVTTFTFTMPESLYDTSDEDILFYKCVVSAFTETIKQQTEAPKGHTLKGVLKDSKGRTVSQ